MVIPFMEHHVSVFFLCKISVEVNSVGMVLLGGLNPVAVAEEMGIQTENQAMSTTMEFSRLRPIWEIA